MKTRITLIVTASAAVLAAPSLSGAAFVTANELGYAISLAGNNSLYEDYTVDPFWAAGSQRSSNGSADPNNRRSGRFFVEFVLTQALIDEANLPGASLSLGFTVASIGSGVAGTPYSDGLDLRYFGIASTNPTPSGLWNTAAAVPDQADVLATNASAGAKTTVISDATILNAIKGATANQRISFGLLNSVGTVGTTPVGNSSAETYAFAMDHGAANYNLTIVPEPSAAACAALGSIALLGRRRFRRPA